MEGLYCLCSKNKGADQLHSNCAADLRLCFRTCKKPVFSQRGSNGIGQQFSLSKPSTLDIAVQCCALSGLCACLTKGFYCLLLVLFEPRCEKTGILLCENKDADQLRGNRKADQHLCFRYIDSTIRLLSKYEISSL